MKIQEWKVTIKMTITILKIWKEKTKNSDPQEKEEAVKILKCFKVAHWTTRSGRLVYNQFRTRITSTVKMSAANKQNQVGDGKNVLVGKRKSGRNPILTSIYAKEKKGYEKY
jgi:hypothetical protein